MSEKLRPGCKLNLGCGFDIREGWVNIDFQEFHKPDIVCDVTRLDSIPNGIASFILAQDVLEHLPRTQTLTALKEWNRVLMAGGEIDVRAPDIVGLAHLMSHPKYDNIEGHLRLTQCMFGTQAYSGDYHLTGFTDRTIRYFLDEAGFEVVSLSHKDQWLFEVLGRKVRSFA